MFDGLSYEWQRVLRSLRTPLDACNPFPINVAKTVLQGLLGTLNRTFEAYNNKARGPRNLETRDAFLFSSPYFSFCQCGASQLPTVAAFRG